MEYVIFLGVIVIALILFVVKGLWDQRNQKIKFRNKLRDSYGKFPEKEYHSERIDSLGRYFEKHQEGFQIDSITWNDLEMDRLFTLMDHSHSATGEEYLYHTLRTLKFDLDYLKEQDRKVDYFMKEQDKRIYLQEVFAGIGYTGKYSIYDYLDYLDNMEQKGNIKHILQILAFIPCILLATVDFFPGLMTIIGLACYNIVTYIKDKREMEPFITSFSYLFRILNHIERIGKVNAPVIQNECEELKNLKKNFKNFYKNSGFVMKTADGSNPLDVIFVYMNMLFHFDLMVFNRMFRALTGHKKELDQIISICGYLETILSIGCFRASLDKYCVPEFVTEKGISTTNLYHPYLKEPVKNTFQTQQGILLTGSNASGKSTFLKTVAINAVLAQTVFTVLADNFTSTFFRVMTSMALRDNMEQGESYYIVEIKSLKRILDQIGTEQVPVLCFVDEVLRGTNTVERIAASSRILKSLSGTKVLSFAATHDIELTSLLEQAYDNYHFEEEFKDGDIVFPYILKMGKATSRNAIQLLGIIGYEENIIEEANQMAKQFVETGRWSL